MTAPPAPPALRLAYHTGDRTIFAQLNALLSAAGPEARPSHYDPTAAQQRITVVVTFPKSNMATLQGHPGHCGVAVWNVANSEYVTAGIWNDGSFGSEHFTLAQLRADARYEVWYFTTGVDAATARNLLRQMRAFLRTAQGYAQVLGTRIVGTYNCVTAVDAVLGAGDLSYGVASSISTPYLYSCSFVGWTAAFVDNARHD